MHPTNNCQRSRNHPLQGKTLGIALLVSLTTACGVFGTPDCADSDVMGLLDELSRELVADEMVPTFIMQTTGMSPRMWGNPDYAALKASAANSEDPAAKAVLERLEQRLAQIEFKFEGIRANDVDERVHKTWCGAQRRAFVDGKDVGVDQVSYTAQYTGDGQVYVEIQP